MVVEKGQAVLFICETDCAASCAKRSRMPFATTTVVRTMGDVEIVAVGATYVKHNSESTPHHN